MAQWYMSEKPGPCAAMSASPSGRTKSDGAENVVPAPATCVLRQGEPGVAQWYISVSPGPRATMPASPSGRTKIDDATFAPSRKPLHEPLCGTVAKGFPGG